MVGSFLDSFLLGRYENTVGTDTCHVPGSILRAFHILPCWVFTTTQGVRHCYPRMADEEAEAPRGSRSCRCKWKSQAPDNMASVCALTDSVTGNGPLQRVPGYRAPPHASVEPSRHLASCRKCHHCLHLTCVKIEWPMEKPGFKSSLTASKAMSFVVFLPPQTWSSSYEPQTYSDMGNLDFFNWPAWKRWSPQSISNS